MTIKDDELYPKYLLWLDERKMSSGSKELSKISKDLFNKFKFRYEFNPSMKEEIDNKYKSIDRDEKIDNLVKDDFELFLEELDLGLEPPPFEEDLF
jgi:hypothetical protein